MPPWIPKVILMLVGAFFGILAIRFLLVRLHDLIFMLVVALFLSFALEPAVNWLAARGWRRGAATGLVLVVLLALGGLLVASMVPLVVDQVRGLIDDLPGWLTRISRYTDRWFGITLSTAALRKQLQGADASLGSYAGNAIGLGASVVSKVFMLFTIGLFTFYLVADGPRVRRTVCSVLPVERQRTVLWAWDVAIAKTGGYLYSRILLAAFSAVATFIVLLLLGIPFALPLALWVGIVSQFIPVVGTYLAIIVPLLVALLEDPLDAVFLLAFVIVYQQFENYVLGPRITARTMAMHPAIAFGAVIAGGGVAGPVGAFLALPAAAILQAGLSTYLTRHEVMDSDLTRDQPVPATRESRPRRRWRRRERSEQARP